MIVTVTTASNSTYMLDETAKTWKRTGTSLESGTLRTEGDPYDSYVLTLGEPLRIYGPPVTDGADGRLILTSPVITFLREHDE